MRFHVALDERAGAERLVTVQCDDGSAGIEMSPLAEVPSRDYGRQKRALRERDDCHVRRHDDARSPQCMTRPPSTLSAWPVM